MAVEENEPERKKQKNEEKGNKKKELVNVIKVLLACQHEIGERMQRLDELKKEKYDIEIKIRSVEQDINSMVERKMSNDKVLDRRQTIKEGCYLDKQLRDGMCKRKLLNETLAKCIREVKKQEDKLEVEVSKHIKYETIKKSLE